MRRGRQRLALAPRGDDHELVVGVVLDLLGPTSSPSGTSMWPSWRPMFTFLRIERPTSETLRPSCAAASTTCCTRWMFDGFGDHDPPLAAGEHLLEFGAHRRLRLATSRGGRRWWSRRRGAAAVTAQLRQPRHVCRGAVDRRLVELVVAGHERGPQLAGEGDGERVGIECAIFTISPNGPASKVCVARTSCSGASWSLCSSSLERAIATVSGRRRSAATTPAAGTAARRRGPRARA